MSFNVIASVPFERKVKRLSKKYRSLKKDLSTLIDSLSINPIQGTPLGKDCYKIRMSVASKGKGKSGGARVITYVRFTKNTVFLMDVYDKSEQSTISDKELWALIQLFTL